MPLKVLKEINETILNKTRVGKTTTSSAKGIPTVA
jgi:hypothetical protein